MTENEKRFYVEFGVSPKGSGKYDIYQTEPTETAEQQNDVVLKVVDAMNKSLDLEIYEDEFILRKVEIMKVKR
jgi:hypothetical protein